ncbi:hypothetical protein ACJX0J_009195, partial [Zea mays]
KNIFYVHLLVRSVHIVHILSYDLYVICVVHILIPNILIKFLICLIAFFINYIFPWMMLHMFLVDNVYYVALEICAYLKNMTSLCATNYLHLQEMFHGYAIDGS